MLSRVELTMDNRMAPLSEHQIRPKAAEPQLMEVAKARIGVGTRYLEITHSL